MQLPTREYFQALFATIQEQVKYRQVGLELSVQLRIDGMNVILPLHGYAVFVEQCNIKIITSRAPAEVFRCVEMSAEIEKTLVAIAGYSQLRRSKYFASQTQPFMKRKDERNIKIYQPLPIATEQF